jgi:flagellar motor switch protein FliG
MTGEEKVATLLYRLPRSSREALLTRLSESGRRNLQNWLQRLEQSPQPTHVLDDILKEFESSLESASSAGNPPGRGSSSGTNGISSGAGKNGSSPVPSAEGDDALAGLRSLAPEKLGAALQDEQPATISAVLNCLDTDRAGELLKRLPAERQVPVFLHLSASQSASRDLALFIADRLVAKVKKLEENPAPGPGDESDRAQTLARVLRAQEPAIRTAIFTSLRERDETLAAKVDENLYSFDDLLTISNQSIQKVLAETDMRTLVTSLKNAPPEIRDAILRNVSKRVRESLDEEMSLLSNVPETQIQEARKAIVDVIRRLDQEGTLVKG